MLLFAEIALVAVFSGVVLDVVLFGVVLDAVLSSNVFAKLAVAVLSTSPSGIPLGFVSVSVGTVVVELVTFIEVSMNGKIKFSPFIRKHVFFLMNDIVTS